MLAFWAQPVASLPLASRIAIADPFLERVRAAHGADAALVLEPYVFQSGTGDFVRHRMRLLQRELDDVGPVAEADVGRIFEASDELRRALADLTRRAERFPDNVDLEREAQHLTDIVARLQARAEAVRAHYVEEAARLGTALVDVPAHALGLPVMSPTRQSWTENVLPNAAPFHRWTAEAQGQIVRTVGDMIAARVTPAEAHAELESTLALDSAATAKRLTRAGVNLAQTEATVERMGELADRTTGLRKEWSWAISKNPRWYHEVMDGISIPYDDSFKVPNPKSGYTMMRYPHDPEAPDVQKWGCRCALLVDVNELALA